jgi:hypothetical protein
MRLGNRNWLRSAVGLALLTMGSATLASAQERSGFFFGVGLGYGSLGLSCDDCGDTEREDSFSGHFRLGGAVSPQFLLGGESVGWYKDEDGGSLSFGTLTGNAYYYPSKGTGLFLKGGLGLGYTEVQIDFLGSETETGFGWQVGAGYDIRLGTKTALTPTITYAQGHFDGFSENLVQIGVAFSMY